MACLRTRAEPFSLCALNTSLRSRKYCVKARKKHRIRFGSKCPPHTVPPYKLIFVFCLTGSFMTGSSGAHSKLSQKFGS